MPGHAHQLLIFDVNETLSDMSPLRARFTDVGAPAHLMDTWFAGVLRDGFALTAAGSYADFATLARDGVRALLSGLADWTGNSADAVRHVVGGFAELDVHPDVPDGVRALREAGFRLVTMTNGSVALTERLLTRAGVLDCFEALLDVGGPRCWKPAPAAYRYAVDQAAGARPDQAMLVAVHPWDVDGALRAGLAGAWLRRAATTYPEAMRPPTLTASDLSGLVAELTEP